jgi:ribosomal protein S16
VHVAVEAFYLKRNMAPLWLDKGAQPTSQVRKLLHTQGIPV